MAEIPFINTNFNVEKSSPTFFNPEVGLKAIEIEAENNLGKLNLFKEAKDNFYKSNLEANKAKGNKLLLDLANEVQEEKQNTLMDPKNTLGYNEVWDKVLSPKINSNKNKYLKLFRYEDRSDALETFNKAVITMKSNDNNDNWGRKVKEDSAFIAGELNLAINKSKDKNLSDEIKNKNQERINELQQILKNNMGETVANNFVSDAYYTSNIQDVQKLLQDLSLKKITYSTFEKKLENISTKYLTETDKNKQKSEILKLKSEYDEQFVKKQTTAIDLISEAIVDDKVDFNAPMIFQLTENMPDYLKDKINSFTLRALKQKSKGKGIFKNKYGKMLDFYLDFMAGGEKRKKDAAELFEMAGGDRDAQGFATYLYMDLARIQLQDGDIIAFEDQRKATLTRGKDMQLTQTVFTPNFVKQIDTYLVDGLVPGLDFEKLRSLKFIKFNQWAKQNPNATEEQYKEFVQKELGVFIKTSIDKADANFNPNETEKEKIDKMKSVLQGMRN